jgi:NTP pyrophosphatase (non-canonical NTP hydrolase)
MSFTRKIKLCHSPDALQGKRDKNMANKAIPANSKEHMTLAQYQTRAHAANQFKGQAEALNQLRFGLFGEIGGLLAAVKKSHRDVGAAEQAIIKEELGDCVWYLTEVTAEYQQSLEEVGAVALSELQRRFDINKPAGHGTLTFVPFDGLLGLCHVQLTSLDRSKQLSDLASRAGQLLSDTGAHDLASAAPLTLLGALMADMVTVAGLFDLRFIDVVDANLEKFESRWPQSGAKYLERFDSSRPLIEQFPSTFEMHFIEREYDDGKPYVILRLNDVNIGDRLTDNRTEPDGYRFHDVFHLAYIAHLGWSPVIRSLLKLKRKGDKDLDENQDGARAMIIEEGIATWIFNHAHRRDYYENTAVGKLEYGLLKQVRDMVDGYEVAVCPLWQWEKAILEGFKVFRQLRDAGRGIVKVDMLNHTISFASLDVPSDPSPAPRSRRSVHIGSSLPPTSI